jgi:hypothetical protein
VEIKTNIIKRDWVAFHFAQLLDDKKTRLRLFAQAFVPPVVLLALVSLILLRLEPGRMRTISFWLSLLAVPLWLSIFYSIIHGKLSRQAEGPIKEGKYPLGESEIFLSQDGIAVTRDSNLTVITWKEVTRVKADASYGFVFVNDGSVIIIPRRSFSDHTAFEMFVKTAVIFHWHGENAIKAAATEVREIPSIAELEPVLIPMPSARAS